MKKKILMLAGRINSGKDYTADLLVKHAGWTKMTFAEHLKNYVSQHFNIPITELYTQDGKCKIHSNEKSYRQILIESAADLKKDNQDYFVNKLVQKIRSNNLSTNIVISDFRYPNEYQKILQYLASDFDIITARVHRTQEVVYEDNSENALENFTFNHEIDNNTRDTVRLNWFF